ncbi:hypothetical protein R6Q59_035011 [Mikania micrantha]
MDHPFLQFDPNDEGDAPCIPVLHSLWGYLCQIEPMKCLSWDLVVNLNQQTRLQPLITEPWSRLLYINRPLYRQLLMEFFSSYSFSFPSQNIYQNSFGLTFRWGGRWRRLSVAQFATRMGLYTEGELDTEVFDGLYDFEDEIEKATFWAEVAEGVYDPRRAKAIKLRYPLHRLIHRILFGTIIQRGDILGNVPTRDLFYLYCLIRGIHCNIAHCLAFFLTTNSGKQASSHICGGAYITQLADSYGLLTEENIASFTHVCDTPPLDMRTLSYMKIVEQTPVSQEELCAEQEGFNQCIDNFQAEQTRQYDLLHQIQDDHRRSFGGVLHLIIRLQHFISLTFLSRHGSTMAILRVAHKNVLGEVMMGKRAVLVRMMTRRTSLMFSLLHSLACPGGYLYFFGRFVHFAVRTNSVSLKFLLFGL